MTHTMLPVAILAGGLATRMRPLTERVPKSMLMIHDEPFIVHQLRYLAQQGIQKVVICLGYLGEQIVSVIGDGHQFGLSVFYSWDGDTLLGTGGALKKAAPMLGSAFFILYGDSYLECDYKVIQAAFEAEKKLGLMTVYKNQSLWDKSNVLFVNHQIIKYDKANFTPDMLYIDYGLGILATKSLTDYPDNQSFDLAHVYQKLLSDNQLAGYEVYERFYEIGSHVGFNELKQLLQPTHGSALS